MDVLGWLLFIALIVAAVLIYMRVTKPEIWNGIPQKGDRVEFKLATDQRTGKLAAVDVRPLD
jgi:hypothetical protein